MLLIDSASLKNAPKEAASVDQSELPFQKARDTTQPCAVKKTFLDRIVLEAWAYLRISNRVDPRDPLTRAKSEPLRIYRPPLIDEGLATAIYPYVKLKEILCPDDCRRAVIDETEVLELDFGHATVEPLYKLLWTLNGAGGVFTSHIVIAKPNHPPPFAWAKSYVAVAIILLSRDRKEHQNEKAVTACADELGRIISAEEPTQDSTGWRISVGPCNVVFTTEMSLTTFGAVSLGDTIGYGCQLIVGGAASNRRRAAQRWGGALNFVNIALHRKQQGDNVQPATPHRHLIAGALPHN
jgi:hypothetical protein